jgi:hypothetical protein
MKRTGVYCEMGSTHKHEHKATCAHAPSLRLAGSSPLPGYSTGSLMGTCSLGASPDALILNGEVAG